jgi:hypothetical protein
MESQLLNYLKVNMSPVRFNAETVQRIATGIKGIYAIYDAEVPEAPER